MRLAEDLVDEPGTLLIIGPSKAKVTGGSPRTAARADWPEDLLRARADLLPRSVVDDRTQLPAWQRYRGHFYRHVGDALPDAAASGRLLILSGGYGVARADEPIACYDRKLRLRDWPPGTLEAAIQYEVQRLGTRRVLGFVSKSADYAKLLRRVRWDVDATLVTIDFHGGGAQAEVPKRLAHAFAAVWLREPERMPPGVVTEPLS
ncbi:hypothetical protein [Amycolatopsis sp. FDAARGOS 1241]|uniref:hypothetical protein n=1 Tax=Amycolatopsis sp. FDAARGOS 1241 TaxID=2778070 RepID=UPI00194EB205|nr:hypothetical protein [Amycolatopsis sp. FDAARGOS 1241]QRP43966.1 hypothetical protein I6J71_32230 [Amycolatopsis sp. FDAARGOS 1241]